MHIDDLIMICLNNLFIQNGHKAGQNNQICIFLEQCFQQCVGILIPTGIVFRHDHACADAIFFCPC